VKGGADMKVKVVKATTASNLESNINAQLNHLVHHTIIDIKVSGAYDGKDEAFIAVIMYK
jgi:hypothetical protein